MVVLELKELDVDGCGTDVVSTLTIKDYLTNGEKERVLKSIRKYQEETEDWQTTECFEIAYKQLKEDGYEPTFVDLETISF